MNVITLQGVSMSMNLWMKDMQKIGSNLKENRDYSELYRAVNELKEELRIPVILYYMEEFNIREIAQILEISEVLYKRDL